MFNGKHNAKYIKHITLNSIRTTQFDKFKLLVLPFHVRSVIKKI